MNKSCYYCGSVNIINYRHTYYGKARGKCKTCNRQFVFERKNHSLSQEQKQLIEKLLLERLYLEGICRVLNISTYLLYNCMEEVYAKVPEHLHAQVPSDAQIELKILECEAAVPRRDELWRPPLRSFVGNKGNKQWLWPGWRTSSTGA